MSTPSSFTLALQNVTLGPLQNLSHTWSTGVSWICGDEGKGKTTLLRLLAGEVQPTQGKIITAQDDAFWIDLQRSKYDTDTALACWNTLRARHSQWSCDLQDNLVEALNMTSHIEKPLHTLSTGSRRKVMLIAALASGASVTLLDQPFMALDLASIRIIQEFLNEVADHPHRAWLVADYTVPSNMPRTRILNLD